MRSHDSVFGFNLPPPSSTESEIESSATEEQDLIKLIVGLGNPGTQYDMTRHNVGFWCVNSLIKKTAIEMVGEDKYALSGEWKLGRGSIVVSKPNTYVNDSGSCVKWLLRRYNANARDLLVVCDDMNLEQGKLRLRRRGGDGGHNGIKSVIGVLGTKEFPRMRIGIGHPPDGINDVEYVLGKMTAGETKMMTVAVNSATEAVICAATLGLTEAMNRFN